MPAPAIPTQSLGGLTRARSSRNPSQPISKSLRKQGVRCRQLLTCDHGRTTWGPQRSALHTTFNSQNTEETETRKYTEAPSPGGLRLEPWLPAWTVCRVHVSGFKSYPITCWLNAPRLKPQFPRSQTGMNTAPHTCNVDFTHRKH